MANDIDERRRRAVIVRAELIEGEKLRAQVHLFLSESMGAPLTTCRAPKPILRSTRQVLITTGRSAKRERYVDSHTCQPGGLLHGRLRTAYGAREVSPR